MSTTTDKELLELAARAAGYQFDSTDPFEICIPHKGGDNYYEWNPLTDDGDALRLAVKMRFELNVEDYGASVREYKTRCWTAFEAHLHGGIEAATRRAIVVAAAEIERAKEAA